jgi:AraC-like DNA-binding protein
MARLVETRPTGAGRVRGVVSSRASGARVRSATFAPPRDLADVVEDFWASSWSLPAHEPHTLQLVSDPSVNVAYEASDDVDAAIAVAVRVVGVHTGLFTRTLRGRGRIRAVKLKPGAAGAFFDDASAFTDSVVALGSVVDDVPDASAVCDDVDDEFAALVAWLRRQRRPARSTDTGLAVGACAVIAHSGIARVDELVEVVGLSTRELQRLFRQQVGAPPKFVIRRHRLQEVAVRIDAGVDVDVTALAAELGYVDAAHLSHDVRRLTGRSPRALAHALRVNDG